MVNYMTRSEDIKWDRTVIWLGSHYLGKTIRTESSRNMLSGANKGPPGEEDRCWQPSAMIRLAKAVA